VSPPAPLQQEVERLLREELHLAVPGPDADLIASGLLDSLALVELIYGIERSLGRRIDLETLVLDDWRSVRRIAATLSRTPPADAPA
jgi:acyl carrier protein